jgi:hypothetical protein
LGRLPAGDFRAGTVLGAVTTVLLAPGSCALLIVLTSGGTSRAAFVVFKALLGVALGTVVTPIVAIKAMTQSSVLANAELA